MKILFVCVGNICRSPVMHHLLQKKIEERGLQTSIEVDSCAISKWNMGLSGKSLYLEKLIIFEFFEV